MPIRLALSSWSFHTEFLNSNIAPTRFAGLAKRELGVTNIEFYEGDYAPDFLDDSVDEWYSETIRQTCDDHDVIVCCISTINDLSDPSDSTVENDIRRLVKWASHCKLLGCRTIRVNTGRRPINDATMTLLERRLQEVLQATSRHHAVLALENHPSLLTTLVETEQMLQLIDHLQKDWGERIMLCPDVGQVYPDSTAADPDFWRKAIEMLAPAAAHVHLKPCVYTTDGNRIISLDIDEYGPIVARILRSNNFDGAVSVEYMDFGLDADPFERTHDMITKAANAFDVPLLPFNPRSRETPPVAPTINNDGEFSPAESTLTLLVAGCEQKLDAPVRIYDFASRTSAYSEGAGHRYDPLDSSAGKFIQSDAPTCSLRHYCSLTDSDPISSQKCQHFHHAAMDLIRCGKQSHPKLCICPMGLMVLSVPIIDQRGMLYGVITCGPWIELGTDGGVSLAILSNTSAELRQQFIDASLNVKVFSVGRIKNARKTLGQLANDLAAQYGHRRDLADERSRHQLLEIFMDGARHDLSSPLQGISDRVLDMSDHVDEGTLSIEAAIPLIEELHDFTREAGMVVQRFEVGKGVQNIRERYDFTLCNASDAIRTEIRRFALAAKRRSITFNSNVDGLCAIHSHPAILSQLFGNLIDNAVKFASAFSTIIISGWNSDDTAVTNWSLGELPGQRFQVVNKGVGIPDEGLKRAFEPYVRLHDRPIHGRVVKGTGLGLYICRQIVEAHGGSIRLRSIPRFPNRSMPYVLDDSSVSVCVDLPIRSERPDEDADL